MTKKNCGTKMNFNQENIDRFVEENIRKMKNNERYEAMEKNTII